MSDPEKKEGLGVVTTFPFLTIVALTLLLNIVTTDGTFNKLNFGKPSQNFQASASATLEKPLCPAFQTLKSDGSGTAYAKTLEEAENEALLLAKNDAAVKCAPALQATLPCDVGGSCHATGEPYVTYTDSAITSCRVRLTAGTSRVYAPDSNGKLMPEGTIKESLVSTSPVICAATGYAVCQTDCKVSQ